MYPGFLCPRVNTSIAGIAATCLSEPIIPVCDNADSTIFVAVNQKLSECNNKNRFILLSVRSKHFFVQRLFYVLARFALGKINLLSAGM